MATAHEHRLLLIAPVARRAALNTWFAANVDSEGGAQTFAVGLSPAGQPPATHYWCSGAWTDQQLRLILQRLCVLAGIAFPADWTTRTKAQKLSWLAGQRDAIRVATGIRVVRDDGDGAWSSPHSERGAAGLQVIGRVAP